MAEAAEAVARLRLDATGFDKQANASFREFSKQLTSVKDATDVAMRGAEALQKVFVKSLGGTIAIGAATALGDAMRDVGNKIGSAGQAAADAQSGLKGLAKSFEDGASRAEKMQSAASAVAKTLEELKNSGPLNAGIFKAFGGEQTLSSLQESLRGASDAEMLGGAIASRDRARAIVGMSPSQIQNYDLQQSRKAQIDAAKQLGPDFRDKTIRALQESFAAEDAGKLADMNRQETMSSASKTSTYDGELYSMQRDRESARNRADFQAGLEQARKDVDQRQRSAKMEQDRQAIFSRISAASRLMDEKATAEERKKAIDREVIQTQAAAAAIAQGVGGSARGPGQRMTSTEIGINRRVTQEYNRMVQVQSKVYRNQVAMELAMAGQDHSGYAVNKEIERRRKEDAKQQASAPFEAAKSARDQQDRLSHYLENVDGLLKQLTQYAHVT